MLIQSNSIEQPADGDNTPQKQTRFCRVRSSVSLKLSNKDSLLIMISISVMIIPLLVFECLSAADSQQNEELQQMILHVTQFCHGFCQQDLLRLQTALQEHNASEIWVSSVVSKASRRAENGLFQMHRCAAQIQQTAGFELSANRRVVVKCETEHVKLTAPAFTIIKQCVDILLTPSWMFDRRLKIKASSQKHYPQISVSTAPHLSPRNRPFHMP